MSVLGGVWPVQAMACDGLRMVKGGTVVNVVDGDTVLLDSGMVVRLIFEGGDRFIDALLGCRR